LGCWPSISRWPCASGGVIGASGEDVEAGALRLRVDVFRLKSTRGGLHPLPHVATRRRRRDASLMTCPMSPSKHALLPQREVAVTIGYWRTHNDAKNSRFFRGSAQRRKHDTHHTDARVGTGRVGRGRGVGGGVLLARVTASLLGEGTRRVTMEIAPWCGAIYCILDGVA